MTDMRNMNDLTFDIAHAICKRGMAVPAVLMLEAYKPLSRIFHQLGSAFAPLVTLFVGKRSIDLLSLLEERDGVEKLILAIEHYSSKDKMHKGQTDGN